MHSLQTWRYCLQILSLAAGWLATSVSPPGTTRKLCAASGSLVYGARDEQDGDALKKVFAEEPRGWAANTIGKLKV